MNKQTDLFGYSPPPPQLVRLDRTIDREHPCCSNSNIAELLPGKGVHAAGLRCAGCGQHRGWMPKATFDQLNSIIGRFGAPAEPPVARDATIDWR
jgi:hypothetical protein